MNSSLLANCLFGFCAFSGAGLWTPIYLTAFGLAGLPPIVAIPTSLLLGTVGWREIYALVLIFFLPASGNISLIMMFLLTTIYSSQEIQGLDKSPPEIRSPFFVAGWAILLSLTLIAWQFSEVERGNGAFNFLGPQPFYRFELTPIWACFWLMMAVGWARVDRLARWLEMPKGFRRFLPLPSLFTTFFLSQGYIWGWLRQIERWRPEDCFSASAAFTFAFGGILHWLWFNWTWAEKTPPEKSPMEWLTETIAWRTVTLIVPLLGCWLTSLPLSHLNIGFLNLWLMVFRFGRLLS